MPESPGACRAVKDLLPAYALGSLDGADRSALESHLAVCARCRASLRSFDLVQAQMLVAFPSRPPPPRLWARLAAGGRTRGGLPAIRWPAPSIGAWLVLTAIASTLSLLIGLAAGLSPRLASLDRRLAVMESQQSSLAEDLQADRAALALLSYPTARQVLVRGEGTYGTLVVEGRLRVAVLFVWGLPPLPEDLVYQAWWVYGDGGRGSAGVFPLREPAPMERLLLTSSEPVNAYAGIEITVEPPGGGLIPSGESVLAADF